MNESAVSKKHYPELDVAKGIAIIAVVLGHCFPNNIFNGNGFPETVAQVVYDFVYCFHMPLFFWVSGFLSLGVWKKRETSSLYKRIKRLLIPYLTFSVLYIPLRLFMSGMANSTYTGYWKILIGDSPNGGVWYLYELFLFLVVTFLIIRNRKILNIALVISGALVLAVHLGIIVVTHSILNYFLMFYFYFLLGLTSAITTEGHIEKLPFIKGRLMIKVICFVCVFVIYEYFRVALLSPILAIIGLCAVLSISQWASSSKWLEYFGKSSMEIYLLHGPVLVVLRWILMRVPVPKLMAAAIMFVMAIVISLFVGRYILHSNHLFELLFWGMEMPKKADK